MNAQAHRASAGRLWWIQSLQLLRQQPLALLSLVFFYFLLLLLFKLIPIAGSWIALLLAPGLAVGFARASEKAAQSEPVTPRVFFEVFFTQPPPQDLQPKQTTLKPIIKPSVKPLLLLGVFYMISFFLACGFSALFDGGQLFSTIILKHDFTTEMPQQSNLNGAWLTVACLFLPTQILFWFAPLLVAWNLVAPAKALFFSAIAVKRNLGALVVLNLCIIASALLGLLLLSILQAAMGNTPIAAAVQSFAFFLVGAILIAWFNCANYISYVHIFRPAAAIVTPPSIPT